MPTFASVCCFSPAIPWEPTARHFLSRVVSRGCTNHVMLRTSGRPYSSYSKRCKSLTHHSGDRHSQLSITTHSGYLPSSDNLSLSSPASGARFASCHLLSLFP